MSLEDQIAGMTNPQEFTRLCNVVFTERYGTNYQIIDGTRADEGNDGYVMHEERIIAIFCPIKPEKKTDKDFIYKIRSDLEKAVTLNKSGKYRVKNWTFVTPRKLSSSVISEMRKEARHLGLDANHQESTFLANELFRNKHLISAFPELYLADVDSKLGEIRDSLRNRQIQDTREPPDIDSSRVYKPDTKDNEDFDRVVALRRNEPTDEGKAELRTYFYGSTDPSVQINALLGLLDWYDPVDDAPETMIELCEHGLRIATQVGGGSIRAYFLAQKGYYLSFVRSTLHIRTHFSVLADNVIGLATVSEEDRQKATSRLRNLEEQYSQAFNDGLQLAKDASDLEMLASVLLVIGNAAGQRATYLDFPRIHGHRLKQLDSSPRTQPVNGNRGSSVDVAGCKTLRCTQRHPVWRLHGWHNADHG